MPLDPVRVEDARAWLVRAATDIGVAEHNLIATPPFLADTVFHCQQAVEKLLKGFLAWHDVPFRKTHDLVDIGRLCISLDASLEPPLLSAGPLTDYAWRYRYPGDPEEPSLEEAHSALAIARAVQEAVLARLPEEVRP